MSSAQQISKYIITKCTNDSQPISNLQLQKILYYVQREFLQRGKLAFNDDFEAWQFGPVIPSVYRQYCGFGAIPIRMKYNVSVNPDAQFIIDSIVEQKRRINPWTLVNDTHKEGKAWSLTYQNGLGNYHIIPKELIRNRG